MIINLNQREIEAALRAYISQQGINLSGKQVEINFTAGRKESGISAELDIGDVGEVSRPPSLQYPPLSRTPQPGMVGTVGIMLPAGDAGFVADKVTLKAGDTVIAQIPAEPEPEDLPEPAPVKAEVPAKSAVSLFS